MDGEHWRGSAICCVAGCHEMEKYCVIQNPECVGNDSGSYDHKQTKAEIKVSRSEDVWETFKSSWIGTCTDWIRKKKGLIGWGKDGRLWWRSKKRWRSLWDTCRRRLERMERKRLRGSDDDGTEKKVCPSAKVEGTGGGRWTGSAGKLREGGGGGEKTGKVKEIQLKTWHYEV